jgi:methylamine utilization protein MauE
MSQRRLAVVLRTAIGTILLATAVGKLLDVGGFAKVLGTYEVFPEGVLFPLALAVPLVELALAVWLYSGRALVGAALASVAMHGAYVAWSWAALARGLHLSNCGCFGVFLARPLTRSTVVEDAVLAAASLVLLAVARRRP